MFQLKKNKKNATGDPFLDSLYEYKPKKEELAVTKKSSNGWVLGLLRWVALALCLALLIGSLKGIMESVLGYQEAGDLYDSLADMWQSAPDEDGNFFGILAMSNKDNKFKATADYASALSGDLEAPAEIEVDSTTMGYIKAKLNALRVQNNDLAGWITIPNTRIDYPVVHTTDNSYYLTHSFERDFLSAGTIFIDCRNKKNLSENYNTVIYGHNMLSGAMFACLSDFFNRNYFNENRYIYIYTDEGIYVYKTFNIYKVKIDKDASYIRTSFMSGEEFVDFCYEMKSHSAVQVDDIDFNKNDRIITLSTCTNSHNANERYCMQAKLIEIQK